MGSWRNTSHDIPTTFSACKIPCCRVHLIINTWLQRWAKEVTVAKWYDSVSVRSVLRPLKLEYIPTKSKVHSLPKKGCWTSNFSLQIISAFVAGSFITLIAAFVVLGLSTDSSLACIISRLSIFLFIGFFEYGIYGFVKNDAVSLVCKLSENAMLCHGRLLVRCHWGPLRALVTPVLIRIPSVFLSRSSLHWRTRESASSADWTK